MKAAEKSANEEAKFLKATKAAENKANSVAKAAEWVAM